MNSNGIIHFWDLPNKIHVILNSEFKSKLMNEFMRVVKTKYKGSKLTGISMTTIRRYRNKNEHPMKIDFLLKIADVINDNNFDLNNIEKNIIWVGDSRSHGIVNPKLPFNLNSRNGARFLAAICNDGWISDGAYYSNIEKDLRDSVKNDTLFVFGGDGDTVKEWIKENDQYLSFPSVIRDVLVLITGFKGIKSENNPNIPKFIFKDKELMFGWIEQTIADEGYVNYHPNKYRKEILWTRCFSKQLKEYKLIRDEIKMLNYLEIVYNLITDSDYKTRKGIIKTKLRLRISRRENLFKLRRMISIPCKRKEETFNNMVEDGFVRYNEFLKIKKTIINLCNENGYVISSELMKKMNYKQIGTASKWIRFYLNEGLLKYVKDFSYGGCVGRIPAVYVLNKINHK